MEEPKAFISYSWSDIDHENWVLDLAKELEESGVHVIIDKWDLNEGDDKYHFMEKMVVDSSIRKVIIICDKSYAEKADSRSGGVGTETQIISKKIYDQVDQKDQEKKFVALVKEKDSDGNSYTPTYLKSRIFIDMSTTELRSENFEQLLRWIFDKPVHQRPERGTPPSFLTNETKISLGTSSRFRLLNEAIKNGKGNAEGLLIDYFDTVVENLERFRLTLEDREEGNLEEKIMEKIDSFTPYRNEILTIIFNIMKYSIPTDKIHSFFENSLPYCFWPKGQQRWHEWLNEHYQFIIYELFLYTVAGFLKYEKFEELNSFLEKEYFLDNSSPDIKQSTLSSFSVFRFYLRSFESFNSKNNLNRINLMGDKVSDRASKNEVNFNDLKQADFTLYLRDYFEERSSYSIWYPNTMIYSRYDQSYEAYLRSTSEKYFNRFKTVLKIDSKKDLESLLNKIQNGEYEPPKANYSRLNIAKLSNFENLCTRP